MHFKTTLIVRLNQTAAAAALPRVYNAVEQTNTHVHTEHSRHRWRWRQPHRGGAGTSPRHVPHRHAARYIRHTHNTTITSLLIVLDIYIDPHSKYIYTDPEVSYIKIVNSYIIL